MKSRTLAIFAFVLFAANSVAYGSEFFARQSPDPRLSIELQAEPAPSQSKFDKYIEELAATAQREVKDDQAQMHEGPSRNKLLSPINPLVLFRWK